MANKRRSRPKLADLKRAEGKTQCWLCGLHLGSENSNKQYAGLCMSCFYDCLDDDVELGLWQGVAV